MTRNRRLIRGPNISPILLTSKRHFYLATVRSIFLLVLSFMSAPSHSENIIATTNSPTKLMPQTLPAANRSPLANDDIVALDKSSTAFNVLANDTDADGDRLIIIEASAKFGAVAFTTDGLVSYAQTPGPARADKITYVVSDSSGGSSVGTVQVFVH